MRGGSIWIAVLFVQFFFMGIASAAWVDECDGAGGGTTRNSVLDACPSGIGGYLRAPDGARFCTTLSNASGYCFYGPAGKTAAEAQSLNAYGCVAGGVGTNTCTVRTVDENDCISRVPNCSGSPVAQRPAAPSYLSATAGNGQISLSWEAVTGATSYAVRRGTSSGSYSSVTGASNLTATSFTNTGLTNGTTYYYVVTARNAAGTSSYSPEAEATPYTSPPPDAPSYLSATAGNGQVDLSWGAVTGATSYTLKRSTSSGGSYTNVTGAVNTAATSFTNTGLTNGTTYYYVVTAKNAVGTSPNSMEASATPDVPPPAPAAPTGLVGVAGTGRAILTWNSSLYATGYTVRRRTTPTGTYNSFNVGGATAYTNTGLTNGTTYYYTVVAQNVSGTSPESNKISVIPLAGLTCTDGTGEGAGVYKDTQKQLYCSSRQTSGECAKVFGCVWNGTQCNRKITCTYAKAATNSTDLLCARYAGDESGCGKFASCAYSGSSCSKR